GAAVDEVVALAAGDGVVVGAAIDGQHRAAGHHGRGVDPIVAGTAVDGELGEAGAGEAVADGDEVVAAIGVEDEAFGGADVERERSWVRAVEAHAPVIGRNGERFGSVAAIDLGGIVAGAALEQVTAVARIPDHAVVAGVAEDPVAAGAAGQHIVAVAAVQ